MAEIAAKESLVDQVVLRNGHDLSSSDSEKPPESQGENVENAEDDPEYDSPPDPDAHLSPEERAKIVWYP